MTEEIYLSEITGITPGKPKVRPSKNFIISDRYVGIEVEIENVSAAAIAHIGEGKEKYWSLADEGSLRNNGAEIISKPIVGSEIDEALNSLSAYFKKYPRVETTTRCGLHVHVDVRDFSIKDLLKFFVVYLITEPVLFKFCGEERTNNCYCVPWNDSILNIQQLSAILCNHRGQIRGILDAHTAKYQALNIRTLFRLGTLEFRHYPGTTDASEIKNWVNVILSIIKFSQDLEYSKLQYFIDTVCPKGRELISEILGDLVDISSVDVDSIIEGARNSQLLLNYHHSYKQIDFAKEISKDSMVNNLYKEVVPSKKPKKLKGEKGEIITANLLDLNRMTIDEWDTTQIGNFEFNDNEE